MGLDQGKTLPGIFRRIRLELAREPGRPSGDAGAGYILLAPLHGDGRLDVDTARTFRDDCTVLRFRAGADNENGYLRRRPGGFWAFHYDLPDGEEDDDPAFKLGEHRFIIGEYVTILENDGAHTYRVADVRAL